MLKKLIGNNKSLEENLLKELINQNINSEKIDKLYKNSNINLNNIYYNDEYILHYCCKKNLYSSVLWLLSNEIDIEIENEKKKQQSFMLSMQEVLQFYKF